MDIRDDLKAYLDGELSPARADEVRQAVEANPELQQEMLMFSKITSSFKAVQPAPTAAAGAKEEVLKKVASKPKLKWFGLPRPIIVVAACALGVLAFGPMLKGSAMLKNASTSEAAATLPAAGEVSTDAAKTEMPSGGFSADKAASPSADMKKSAIAGKASQQGMSEMSRGGVDYENGTSASPATSIPPEVSRPAAVIKNTQMEVKVPDAAQAMNDARKFATEVGGFIENSQMNKPQEGPATATCQLRVPARSNDATLEKLRGLGVVQTETSNGQDVTSEIVDTEARLKNLRNEEESVRIILSQTRRLSEVLAVRDRLNSIREQIEQIDAQRKNLTNLSSYSTINCSFVEKERVKEEKPAEGWAGETWAGAVNGLKAAGQFIGTILINLLVYSVIWAPIALIGVWLMRKNKA